MAYNQISEQTKRLLDSVLETAKQEATASGKPEEEWLTIQEVTEHYKISRHTIRRLRLRGQIIAKKLSQTKSGKVLISKNSVDNMLQISCDYRSVTC